MSDIGKGDWIQCVDAAAPFEGVQLLTSGAVYYVDAVRPPLLHNDCGYCGALHDLLMIASISRVGGWCARRFVPLGGNAEKVTTSSKEPVNA